MDRMALKLAASYGAEVTMLSTSPLKRKDARHLGAHHFAPTKYPAQLEVLAGKFNFIIDTVSAEHDDNAWLKMLDNDGLTI